MKARHINKYKRCFKYCGDDRCDCSASPRARAMRRIKLHRKRLQTMTKAELQEMEHLNGSQV